MIRANLIVGCVALAVVGCGQAENPRSTKPTEAKTITLEILNSKGEPSHSAEAAFVWSANGKYWDDQGNFIKPTDENLKELWDDEGVMSPFPNRKAVPGNESHLQIDRPTKNVKAILALDHQAEEGGIGFVTPETEGPVQIRLSPLVRVHGLIRCGNEVPEWTHAYVYAVGAPAEPD